MTIQEMIVLIQLIICISSF